MFLLLKKILQIARCLAWWPGEVRRGGADFALSRRPAAAAAATTTTATTGKSEGVAGGGRRVLCLPKETVKKLFFTKCIKKTRVGCVQFLNIPRLFVKMRSCIKVMDIYSVF